MAQTPEAIAARINTMTEPGARGQLVARGLARGLIWREGILPPGAPAFTEALTPDLLDYGYLLLSQALQLKDTGESGNVAIRGFRVAAEAIESAVRHGAPDEFQGLHLIVAAAAFHLGRYTARAYSLVPPEGTDMNLSSSERALSYLIRRTLGSLRYHCIDWLRNERHSDENVSQRLLDDVTFDAEDALAIALAGNFHRALAFFDFALDTGLEESFLSAIELLDTGVEAAGISRHVPQWWIHTLARHLVDDLWRQSFHQSLPTLSDQSGTVLWQSLRQMFIQLMGLRNPAEVDLWPSQRKAAKRAVDVADDLIVALPTSAGKTRIAELCILRTFSTGKRVVYVTPLRALSGQLERTLGRSFRPLGYSVSSLYGASGVAVADVGTLASTDLVAATPEKLDFAIRQDPSVLDDVGLIVLDEGHMIGLGTREIRYEVLVQRLLRRSDAEDRRLVCLSAVFSPGESFDDFTQWLRNDAEGEPIHSAWKPTRHRPGTVLWQSTGGRLELEADDERPWVPSFVKEEPPQGKGRKNSFPQNQNEFAVATALSFYRDGHRVLVYCPLRGSVETMATLCLKLHKYGYLPSLLSENADLTRALQVGNEWLGPDHVAVAALKLGIAVHHGGLPRQFLAEIESLLARKILPLAVASPTLAQGSTSHAAP